MVYYGKLYISFVFLLFTAYSCAGKSKPFFRHDYTYLEATKSFYKMHTKGNSFTGAAITCQQEDAILFYPQDQSEAQAVIQLWKNTEPSIEAIGIGVAAFKQPEEYLTIDWLPISEVYHNWAAGQPNDPDNQADCVEMRRKHGKLYSISCDDSKQYYCKKTLASLKDNRS